MRITPLSSTNFTRAFSTKELEKLQKDELQARKELGLEETSAIIFDFNTPSKKGQNYGMGTLNSTSAMPFVDFLKSISQISKIQASPQSEFGYSKDDENVYFDTSPYSGTTFTLGSHTIALDKLCDEKYGSILSTDYVKSLDDNYSENKEIREYNTDYEYVLGKNRDGVLFTALKEAYSNFKNDDSKLKDEFENFKNEISNQTKLNIAYDAKELNEDYDFLTFCQFLAHKQHMETKKELNDRGIKYFGDCLICFSPKEIVANPECFKQDKFIGVEDPNCPETNNIQAWWKPALDYDKLGTFDDEGNIIELDVTGKLLYEKFKNFLSLYDGIRLDAFWQYITPFEYDKNLQGGYERNLGDKILKIIERASIDAKGYFSPDDYILELVGYGTNEAKDLTRNIYPHVYSTAYAEYDENPTDLKNNKGYIDSKFTIGAGNHDNDTLVNMSRDKNKRRAHKEILQRALKDGYYHLNYNSENYLKKSAQEKKEQDFRTAKAAEIFTTSKQYYTLVDLFGMEEKINNTGKVENDNWRVRIPSDYEKFYHSQLIQGYGINFPKSYEIALRAKNSSNYELINALNKASEIYASNGPVTQIEADELEAQGKLMNSFLA